MPAYLSQRDNINTDGTTNRTTQCFISSGTMFLNAMADRFKFTKFDELAYLSTIEGWTKQTRETDTRYDWQVHKDVINTILEGQKRKEFVEIHKVQDSHKKILESLDDNFPVLCSINISKFYNGAVGHIVLIVGYNEIGTFFHDPFGNAKTRYKNQDGQCVLYSQTELKDMIDSDRRCMIIEK